MTQTKPINNVDKIRIDFFDILGYLIPGSALLMILWVSVDPSVRSVWEAYKSIQSIDQKAAIMAVFMAYVMGFVLHALGSRLYDLYRYRRPHTHTQEQWAFIREYGEKHIAILERWYALRALAQNLAAVSLITFAVCVKKWWQFGYYEWWFAAAVTLLLCWEFLKRAKIFHGYLLKDMEAILALNLQEKHQQRRS